MEYRKPGSAYIRNACEVDSCESLQRLLMRDSEGRRRYGRLCDRHHRIRFNMKEHNLKEKWIMKSKIPNDKCIRCEWKGPCDRHRMIPSDGYVPENVRILCPNCHRLVTLGLITIE